MRQKCGTVYGGMDRSGVRMGSPLTGMSENAQVRNNPKAANLPTTAKPTTTTTRRSNNNRMRATIERFIANIKTWRILNTDDAVRGLIVFRQSTPCE